LGRIEYTKKGIVRQGNFGREFWEFWHTILGLFGGLFSEFSRGFRGRGGEGALATICQGPAGFFEVHPGAPAPSAPYSLSFIVKVNIPGTVGGTIKVIVVHGELRERIPDVSGRRGRGLGRGH
jgi:hypothetical protein